MKFKEDDSSYGLVGVRLKGTALYGEFGEIFTKFSKVPKIIIMHGNVVRYTQNTFLRLLKGPILNFWPFKHADLHVQ